MHRTTMAALSALAIAGTAQAQVACESLKGLTLPDVKMTEAIHLADPVPHCKISGVIGKEMNFSVWMPDAWNGRFVMGGQGGFAGVVESQAIGMMDGLRKGYATAGTDTGHTGTVAGAAWALDDMERIVNYAHLAVHRVTEVGKAAVKANYGRAPEKSYFAGCSNGGREALMAAQRYPTDYDGIITGAPVVDFTGVAATDTDISAKMYPDPKSLSTPVLTKTARETLGKAVLARCDKLDGLEDGILSDPRKCNFDLRTVACKGGKKDGCLTAPQIAAVEAIVEGPRAKGKTYHPPFPYGGESFDAGWGRWMAGTKDGVAKDVPSLFYGFGVGFMRYFIMQDANWDYRTLDLPNLAKVSAFIQKTLSPNDPDLSAFQKSGGKMLIYHGWADSALSPLMTTAYIDQVYAKDPGAKSNVKLFMLPGVLHCGGGPGPDQIDYLGVLDKWVATKSAPEELKVGFKSGGDRKVCAYPKMPAYKGSGDGKSADQFECR